MHITENNIKQFINSINEYNDSFLKDPDEYIKNSTILSTRLSIASKYDIYLNYIRSNTSEFESMEQLAQDKSNLTLIEVLDSMPSGIETATCLKLEISEKTFSSSEFSELLESWTKYVLHEVFAYMAYQPEYNIKNIPFATLKA
jgi:hypothetical protein